ncbi:MULTISPECIES: DUF4843 domain-containing protein [Sphingobacterium]|uniref:DUF4843 domain-containing protein n=1 Tax=Sphingobacterium litopenaei TaxID=2763500 RepID=A0ABR7YDU2_9SPHI|nr:MULTISPECIES: DUF4843 domain-containing protein [Sphingobacterium]MBD1429472.1 DUF4843 domain-containing protein [Sphingobacterium litopenaei]NGM74138.1 DUF4843 domain-containing protein [Sphingobacterium sp. SGL-16]
MKTNSTFKYNIGSFLLVFLLLAACQKAELLTYNHNTGIYFNLSNANRDSIVYTFAYNINKASDTIYIPVSISGIREDKDRVYHAYIEVDSSSAQEGVHYQKLAESYVMNSGDGKTTLPLVIYNTPDLEENSVSVIVKLKESADFHIENPNIIRAKVVFSARLEQPMWWSMWLGEYSRTKHQLFLIATEQTTLTMDGLDAPKNLFFADLLNMMLNNPFQWVDKNPEKGYVLSTDDNGVTYKFYHKDNPNRTILLRKNTGSGLFRFIDELGREVR